MLQNLSSLPVPRRIWAFGDGVSEASGTGEDEVLSEDDLKETLIVYTLGPKQRPLDSEVQCPSQ